MKNCIKIAGVYIGIIIGAGFASGQEINSFFTVYGAKWIWGMILSGILFCVTGSAILSIIYTNKIESYGQFMELIMGKKAGCIMEFISGIFLCILFFTMAAATGALTKEAFGFSYLTGVYGILIACFFVFLFDVKGVVAVNSILAPFLILGTILVSVYTLFMEGAIKVFLIQDILQHKWAFSAILYVSYNMITAISVLVPMKQFIKSKKTAIGAGFIGGVSMMVMGICIGMVLFLNYEQIKGAEIPMLMIIEKYAGLIRGFYIALLLSAIFTTALGNGFGAIKWLEEKLPFHTYLIKLVFLVLAGMTSLIGFSAFVGKLYPLFGVLGVVEMLLILKYAFLQTKKVKKI